MMRTWRHASGLALLVLLSGCAGEQSMLTPAGPEAERIALLFWIMTIGGAVILGTVLVLTGIALMGGERLRAALADHRLIIGGGIVFPIVSLTVLLGYGLALTGSEAARTGSGNPIQMTVVGERWWWRVIYQQEQGGEFESANEVRIPVGRPVEISLLTADVIHSFWVPKLAGKLDMIPGRTTKLRLVAQDPGVFRGQCAEYCGGAHALMAFYVVALPEEEYVAWRRIAAGPAPPAATPELVRGEALFMVSGCGGCHTIRGTQAKGTIGPDLTHVGSRLSIGAGILKTHSGTLAAWIVDNQKIKPENLMPPFGIFEGPELESLAAYLASLK